MVHESTEKQHLLGDTGTAISENGQSHSPSNFTDNMPTLNPLKTVVEHDIISRVVVAFCEEKLGCVSVFLGGKVGVRWFV